MFNLKRNLSISLRRNFSDIIVNSTNTSHLPTVYALSTTPNTKSAIAVIRITGNHCKHIYQQLTLGNEILKPRTALLRKLFKHKDNDKPILLDSSLVLFFESPKSFTGEDLLELHVHGGKVVIMEVMKTIQQMHDKDNGINIRTALAGEFSQRAFQNGKFDLTEIEGIRDLIDAETEAQRVSALAGFTGKNHDVFMEWRSVILDNISQLSAIIDFGEDIELDNISSTISTVQDNITQLKRDVKTFIKKVEMSCILQDGIKLSLLGATNTGKSSLINRIANDDISIVSNIPGTTRDVVGTMIDINGYKTLISDTAGIRHESQTSDQIEKLGIEKTKVKIEDSDVCLILIEPQSLSLISPELLEIIKSAKLENKIIRIIINKCDLINNEDVITEIKEKLLNEYKLLYPVSTISCLTGEGIESLISELTKNFKSLSEISENDTSVMVSQRIKDILINDILFSIEYFENSPDDLVLMSESLRDAVEGIGKITGETIGVEEVLGNIFATFCVGK